MADALIKYETIDAHQIDDIMNGKPPRPPQDWEDDKPASGGGSAVTGEVPTPKPGEGTIGGPAGQH